MVDGYRGFGDFDSKSVPSKRQVQRQREAEELRDSSKRMHFHLYTVGEAVGRYLVHSHDDDDPEHVHPPRQTFPARRDGGNLEETGPSLGTEPPPGVRENIARALLRLIKAPRTPDHKLMRWRLRLFCGHVVERTAHSDYKTPGSAFTVGMKCPECGLDPASIVAAEPVGLVAEAPLEPRPDERPHPQVIDLRDRLVKAKAEVARLKSQLESLRDSD